MPRILLASYYFPPDRAVGGLRAAKFARALPRFGWEPIVLTVEDRFRDQGFDYGRLHGLEGVAIVKTRALPTVTGLYVSLKAVARRVFNTDTRVAQRRPVPPTAGTPRARESMRQRLKRYFVSLIVLLPDPHKGWAIYAGFSAVRLIRARKIDYLLTSSPPPSGHFVGLIAKTFTNVTWVADFRDPWLENLHERSAGTRSRVSDAIESWMERQVIRRADKVVTTTERLRQALVTRFPGLPPQKFVCISNSIDTDVYARVPREEKYRPLTITYAGTLYFDRTPEPLFRAVGELLSQQRIRREDISIKLVGGCESVNGADTRELAARHGVEDVVEIIPPVPHAEALRIMQRSHLLLIIAPARHRFVVGAKLFDYLGSGSRVLGLAEDGATADMVNESGGGRCFSNSDVAGLREYIATLVAAGSYASLGNDVESFGRYDVDHLTGRLIAEMSASEDAVPIRPEECLNR